MLHVAGEKRARDQRVSRICSTGYIPLPRSLTRCARSFGCGERCRL
ncbi:plasmid replication initiation protein, partial [Klebsiella pneumoniae]